MSTGDGRVLLSWSRNFNGKVQERVVHPCALVEGSLLPLSLSLSLSLSKSRGVPLFCLQISVASASLPNV